MKKAVIAALFGMVLVGSLGAYIKYRRHYLGGGVPEKLVTLNSKVNPMTYSFLNEARAEKLRARLEQSLSKGETSGIRKQRMNLALQLVNCGKTEEALKEYQILEKVSRANPEDWRSFGPHLLM